MIQIHFTELERLLDVETLFNINLFVSISNYIWEQTTLG